MFIEWIEEVYSIFLESFSRLLFIRMLQHSYVSDTRPTLYIVYSYTFMDFELKGQCNFIILDFTWGWLVRNWLLGLVVFGYIDIFVKFRELGPWRINFSNINDVDLTVLPWGKFRLGNICAIHFQFFWILLSVDFGCISDYFRNLFSLRLSSWESQKIIDVGVKIEENLIL